MAALETWGWVSVVGVDGTTLATRALRGQGRPDLGIVDDLGRLQVRARRLGAHVVVETACSSLLELLELAALPIEVRRQPEHGKDRRRVQEGIERGDPPP